MKTKLLFAIMVVCLTGIQSIAQDKKDEYPKTKISGLIFGDYYYNAVRDSTFNPRMAGNKIKGNNASTGKQDENSVQVRRILFRVNHKLSKNVEGQFMLEADPASSLNSYSLTPSGTPAAYTLTAKTGKLTTFVKDAFIKWKYHKNHELIFGIIPTTAYDIPEDFWGHRFLEKTIMDLRGIAPNRDFGVALRGKIDSIGKFKYGAAFGEGTALVPSNVDGYKESYCNFQYSPILELNDKKDVAKEMTVNVYADFKENKSVANGYYKADGSKGPKTYNGDATTIALFTGYKVTGKYSFGLEFYYSSGKKGFKNTIDSTYADLTGFGFSVFGSYQINEKIGAAARYDYYEPNSNSSKLAKSDTRNYIIAGMTYSPVKGFTLSPNVLVESYETIADGITNADGTKKDQTFKASVTPRVTLLYVFK